MRKPIVAFLIFGLAGMVFLPRALYAKNFFTEKVMRHTKVGTSDEEDSFWDSDHRPLEEEY